MTGHETVLRVEAVDALLQDPNGRYVDCTYGRGGHSQEIMNRIGATGRLMVIDKDMTAIRDARQKFKDDKRVVVVHGSFANLASHVAEHEMGPLDGILMDLGVSSPQLDESERGFSFSHDGPLDMRMDQSSGMTAAQWIAKADINEITDVLRRFGEEKFARRIARKIVAEREEKNIDSTAALVAIIESAVPRIEKHKHPATRSFQAIRIHVNEELRSIEECLHDVVDLLVSGGRLVVISFHSLEDRIVKRFIRKMEKGDIYPDRLPIRDAEINRYMKSIGKARKPGNREIDRNRRSRSSVMRVAEKL